MKGIWAEYIIFDAGKLMRVSFLYEYGTFKELSAKLNLCIHLHA